MNTIQNNSKLVLLIALFFVFAVGAASAQTKSDISFPIAELGNCKSESDCKSYCDKPGNIIACVSFGEKNGLVSAPEAARAREFADVLKGEGPGACKDKEACESYCNDINNVDECLTFAEKHNLIPASELKEAKKVQKVLKEGGKLPGGCSNKKSCDDYCEKPGNIEECFAFAEKAGFIPPEELEHARKAIPLIASGQSPGGCKTKDECQNYCEKEANATECINFAEKAGFVSKEEAEIVRKTGGKGPGDCRSKESCESYCNNPENQESCFKFAEKHGLIPEEKIKEMKEGMMRLKEGLEMAPPEVVSCLKENLGENIIEEIQAGTLTPGPAIGEKVKGCFAGMMKEGLKQFREGLSQMPPEMRACVEEKLGSEKVAKIEAGEEVEIGPEMGKLMEECGSAIKEEMMGKFEQMMGQVPPEIQSCLKEKLGSNLEEKFKSGEATEANVKEIVMSCMANFKPTIPKGMIPPEGYTPSGMESGITPLTGMTPPPDMMGEICEKFSLAPSCDYIPAEFRDLCLKCKQ
ncbi:hypothetical protein A2645_01035 [Candidatus Nomurabacteria bacterium RIFCSPHIGHO2_01_FULL_39_9]|uniref:Uncharacterized protein n=1 Tax=Candidatus Nomurabacteria bacterium RIFCSPHIGHO2_01_FULL_39_9 TaxID=1801735 RepID=A0A1F6UWN2_9BACT|nr:MAG: hypothetical protein A2645_01035 [Candidatus Nomurabacteria bacterium RIFCSPHIGHO2_01_FULL_39_9]